MKQKTALIPGTFDPFTIGHLNLIKKASDLFDNVIISIGLNCKKTHMFDDFKRKLLIEKSLNDADISNFSITHYNDFLVNHAKKLNVDVIVRGIRNAKDLEFEQTVNHFNGVISKNAPSTIFFLADSNDCFISSSAVKEIIETLKSNNKADEINDLEKITLLEKFIPKIIIKDIIEYIES